MELKTYLLAQLDREAILTRKALRRVPEGANDFKPHERSMPLGYMAAMLANMLGWITRIVDREEFDLADPAALAFRPVIADTRAELLGRLDDSVAEARCSLLSATEEHLLKPWAFKIAGETADAGPRHRMIADAVFSHLAHHRGQLTVYLRLNEAVVPALYGPSADAQYRTGPIPVPWPWQVLESATCCNPGTC
jgi:uncharacterized damage-inducible protein DinB